MIILPLLANLVQTPKTFEELELLQVTDTLRLKSFYMEYAVKMSVTGESITEQAKVKSDGKRFHLTLKLNGNEYVDEIEDGKGLWVINRPNRLYFHRDFEKPPPPMDPKWLLPEPGKPSLFNISLGFPVAVQIAADPTPVLQSMGLEMEGTKMYRKAVINATNSTGDLETITEWFNLDRWVLYRATIAGPTVSGDVSVPVIEFFERTSAKDFTPDPKKMEGFSQADSISQALQHS